MEAYETVQSALEPARERKVCEASEVLPTVFLGWCKGSDTVKLDMDLE